MEGNDKECPAGVSRFKQGKKVETLCCALLSMSFVFQKIACWILAFWPRQVMEIVRGPGSRKRSITAPNTDKQHSSYAIRTNNCISSSGQVDIFLSSGGPVSNAVGLLLIDFMTSLQ